MPKNTKGPRVVGSPGPSWNKKTKRLLLLLGRVSWNPGSRVITPQGCDAGAAPPLSTALREQLGLSLRSTKAPVEVLVVDGVERPSAN
jgi:uncharacterized protein (TIGR03435 family)